MYSWPLKRFSVSMQPSIMPDVWCISYQSLSRVGYPDIVWIVLCTWFGINKSHGVCGWSTTHPRHLIPPLVYPVFHISLVLWIVSFRILKTDNSPLHNYDILLCCLPYWGTISMTNLTNRHGKLTSSHWFLPLLYSLQCIFFFFFFFFGGGGIFWCVFYNGSIFS
jgi:hypothetical protein